MATDSIPLRGVGIDIECVDPASCNDDMAVTVFTASERAWIAVQPDPVRAFFTCWVRKEAYGKLLREGLSPVVAATSCTPLPPRGTHIADFVLGADHVGALAMSGDETG